MGVPYLSEAIRSDDLDYDYALEAIRRSRNETLMWADYSTPDCSDHWRRVAQIFDIVESKIMWEGG